VVPPGAAASDDEDSSHSSDSSSESGSESSSSESSSEGEPHEPGRDAREAQKAALKACSHTLKANNIASKEGAIKSLTDLRRFVKRTKRTIKRNPDGFKDWAYPSVVAFKQLKKLLKKSCRSISTALLRGDWDGLPHRFDRFVATLRQLNAIEIGVSNGPAAAQAFQSVADSLGGLFKDTPTRATTKRRTPSFKRKDSARPNKMKKGSAPAGALSLPDPFLRTSESAASVIVKEVSSSKLP